MEYQYNYSIIIPHYNIPDLLMRCLRSIPVREDVQVIVVDDCSPGAIQYKEQYPELSRPYLEFYTTPKGGSAGRARNVGLEHAKGKWLVFADADDFFADNFLSILDRLIDEPCDLLYFQCKAVMSDNLDVESQRNQPSHKYKEYYQTGDENVLRAKIYNPVGKLIKREFVEKHHLLFDETKYSNDVFFSVSCGVYANEIRLYDDVLYYITEREGSLTNEAKPKDKSAEEMDVRLSVALKTKQFLIKKGISIHSDSHVGYGLVLLKKDPILFIKRMVELFFKHPVFAMRFALEMIRFVLLNKIIYPIFKK